MFLICLLSIVCSVLDLTGRGTPLDAHVSNMQTDNHGFLWAATWNGLVRYDGARFFTYQPTRYSAGAIAADRIYNIRTAADGDIYCVTPEGRLYLFRQRQQRFIDIAQAVPATAGRRVKTLFTLPTRATYVVYKDGTLLRLDDATLRAAVTHLRTKCHAVQADSHGTEWVLTQHCATAQQRHLAVRGDWRYFKNIGRHVWLIDAQARLAHVDPAGHVRATRLPVPQGEQITFTTIAAGRYIALATTAAVYLYDTRTTRTTRHRAQGVTYLAADNTGRLWAFTPSGDVYRIDHTGIRHLLAAAAEKRPPAKNPQIFLQTADGTIVLRPQRGPLMAYDEATQTLRPIDEARQVATTAVKKHLVDRAGRLWVAEEHGVRRLTFTPQHFRHTPSPDGSEVRALLGALAATRTGLIYERRAVGGWGCGLLPTRWARGLLPTRTISPATSPTRGTATGRPLLTPHSSLLTLTNSPVFTLARDSTGTLWAGTKGDGIYIIGGRGWAHAGDVAPSPQSTPALAEGGKGPARGEGATSPAPLHLVAPAIASDTVQCIVPAQGRLYIAYYGAGVQYLDARGRLRTIPLPPRCRKVRCLLLRPDGTLLAGTTAGMLALRPLPHHRWQRRAYLPQCDVMAINAAGGKVLLTVYGTGLYEWNGAARFTPRTVQGEPALEQALTAATVGRDLYIVSNRAVARYDTRRRTFRFYRQQPDSSRAFTEATPVVQGRTITIATDRGTMTFCPDAGPDADAAPLPPALAAVQYLGNTAPVPLAPSDTLTLHTDQRTLRLFPASPAGSDARYRYRLDDITTQWSYTDPASDCIAYNDLPHGCHHLTVQALQTDGTWGPGRNVVLHVLPHWHERLAVRLLIAAAILALWVALAAAAIYFRRMRRLALRKYGVLLALDNMHAVGGQASACSDRSEQKQAGKPLVPQCGKSSHEADEAFVLDVAQYVARHLADTDLTVDMLAAHAAMSRSAFYAKMKEVVGLAPVEFLRQQRIRRAMTLLRDPTRTIKDAAYASGFADPKYFARAFKQETGQTPTAWRANIAPISN